MSLILWLTRGTKTPPRRVCFLRNSSELPTEVLGRLFFFQTLEVKMGVWNRDSFIFFHQWFTMLFEALLKMIMMEMKSSMGKEWMLKTSSAVLLHGTVTVWMPNVQFWSEKEIRTWVHFNNIHFYILLNLVDPSLTVDTLVKLVYPTCCLAHLTSLIWSIKQFLEMDVACGYVLPFFNFSVSHPDGNQL